MVGSMKNDEQILKGREAVDAYRQAHTNLHAQPWHRSIPEEHTPLLERMINSLEELGFVSTKVELRGKSAEVLSKFFEASDIKNVKELGFKDREEFVAKATEADQNSLQEKWH